MNVTQDNINAFLNKYISVVDLICSEYNYDFNIKHLLYLILPAFVIKYGINNEGLVLDCFKKIRIYISGRTDDRVQATYNRSLNINDNGYYTDKFVMINNYSKANLPELIDDIVHEYNHAVNSYNNEISYDDEFIKVRTGLCYQKYDKKNLSFVKRTNELSLEEVLNTLQSEEIINIINSFGNYKIENIEFSNTLYALKTEIVDDYYSSLAYKFQKQICDELLKNKTFTPTINNLRLKGLVDDIPSLFDNVIGTNGSYEKLNSLLADIDVLTAKYENTLLFKKRYVNKIISKSKEVISLIKEYDSKCIYK